MAQRKPRKTRPRATRETKKYLPAGTMTGYEPEKLKGLHYPKGKLVHGVPGAGLDETGYSAKAIRLGTQGEKLFSRALKVDKYTQKIHSFWSVINPDPETFSKSKRSHGDIDCILAFGRTILLVDVKFYTSGDGTWVMNGGESLVFIENATGKPFGKPRGMSHAMEEAHATFSRHLPNYTVQSLVVFMPTDRGEATLKNIVWPGNIMAVNYTDFKVLLDAMIGAEKDLGVPPRIIKMLERLLA